jgi:hypothetical protein
MGKERYKLLLLLNLLIMSRLLDKWEKNYRQKNTKKTLKRNTIKIPLRKGTATTIKLNNFQNLAVEWFLPK